MIHEIRLILRYREMLVTTITKELRARYKGSVLGFLWTFVNPLLQLLVYSVAFRYIMRISIPGANFTLFLFVGLVPWSCFSASLVMGSSVIVANATLIKKIYFPRLILPVSSVAGNIVNLLLTMCIMLPVLWFSGMPPNLNYLYFPLVLALQATLHLGFALILSGVYVYFRDLEHILGVVLMALMYMTPIIYNEEMIPAQLFHALKLNPMFSVVTSWQRIFLYDQAPDPMALLYLGGFSLFLLAVGYAVFNGIQRRFAEEL